MNKKLLILIVGFLSALNVIARETITGTVVNDHGEPMPGVRVEVPGSSDFVFTDLDGKFQIVLRDHAKELKFSYPGINTMTYAIAPEMQVTLGKGWAEQGHRFRYMLDLEGGMGIGGKTTIKSGNCEVRNIHTFLMTGPVYTWGYQINKHVFAGLGFGAYLDLAKYEEVEGYTNNYSYISITGINIPVFLTARYDFGLAKKTAPYVDCRIGLMEFVQTDSQLCYCYSGTRLIVAQSNYSSFFIAPAIGYRISIYNKFGMNLGIRYMTGMRNKYKAYSTYQSDYVNDEKTSYFTQRASDVILFNIGFEF